MLKTEIHIKQAPDGRQDNLQNFVLQSGILYETQSLTAIQQGR